VSGPVTRLVVSRLDLGARQGRADAALATGAPVLAALTTPGDTPADWLAAGQALGRVLLEAAATGLQASYLNQPIQVAALRPRLAALLPGDGVPQLLLRLGHPAADLDPAPRRPVEEVVEEA
jgi:hypothetical protein